MAFIEFETEEAYNEAVNAKVSEAVETAINDKNQGWLPDRLKKAHEKGAEEERVKYSDYQQLKDASAGFETERNTWATAKADYEQKIADLNAKHADLTAKYNGSDLQIARLNSALKYGISADDAKRLIGTTPEEIEADAKAFAAAHPKRGSYPAPGSEGGETDGVTAYLKNKYPNVYK